MAAEASAAAGDAAAWEEDTGKPGAETAFSARLTVIPLNRAFFLPILPGGGGKPGSRRGNRPGTGRNHPAYWEKHPGIMIKFPDDFIKFPDHF